MPRCGSASRVLASYTEDEVRAAVLDLPPLTEGEAIEMIDEPAGADTSMNEEAPAPSPDLKVV